MKSISLILIFLLSAATARADAGVGAAVVLAGTFQSLTTTPPLNSQSAQLGFPGGGVLVDFGIGNFRLQSGLLYLQHKTSFPAPVGAITSQTLEIPVLLRYSILPLVSLGAGLYGATFVGTPSNSADFGMVAGVAATLPVGFYDLLVDGRFEQGFTNISPTTKRSEIQILAGVRLGIGI